MGGIPSCKSPQFTYSESKSLKRIAVFGTSGFATEVADICVELNYQRIVFLSPENNLNQNIQGMEVMNENVAMHLHSDGYDFAIGIGNSQIRQKIALNYRGLNFPSLIHPDSSFGLNQRNEIQAKKGNIICAGCRLTNNIKFGEFVLLNLNTTIGHDTVIGNFVSIMPGSNISGNVEIEDSVYIGTGATVLNGTNEKKLKIGNNSIIGAASLVVRTVPSNVTVVGVPCRILSK